MSDLESLIERLAALSGPVSAAHGELEADIWLAVTDGATRNKWSYTHKATGRECWVDETRDKFGHLVLVPRYSESIDAALTLVPEGWVWSLNGGDDCVPSVQLDRVDDNTPNGEIMVDAETTVIALCIAALRARARAQAEEAGK